jgi:hypothetical protein
MEKFHLRKRWYPPLVSHKGVECILIKIYINVKNLKLCLESQFKNSKNSPIRPYKPLRVNGEPKVTVDRTLECKFVFHLGKFSSLEPCWFFFGFKFHTPLNQKTAKVTHTKSSFILEKRWLKVVIL